MTHRVHIGHRVGPRAVGHPDRVRPGQRYFARHGRSREEVTVRSIGRDGFAVCVRRSGQAVRVRCERLLATRSDGSGRYYRWLGWASRSAGYPTEGRVVGAAGEGLLEVALPEWGIDETFVIATGLLPAGTGEPGARITLRANLGARSGAALNPNEIAAAPSVARRAP
jgi:hypothetical protein